MKLPTALLYCSLALVLSPFDVPLAQAQSQAPSRPQSQAAPAKPAAASNITNDALELVKQGQQLSSQGKFDEALALYQRALQLSPNLFQAELATGMTLDLEGKYEQARLHLVKAIEVAAPDQKVRALRTMGVSYAFEGKASESAKYDQQAFDMQYGEKKFEDAAGTADELARIYLESGDIDNGFQWYQTGHLTGLLTPNMTPAQKDLWEFRWESAMARIRARQGRNEEAQKRVANAKALLDKGGNPDQARFMPYIAGYVALYAGDSKTAISELQKANQAAEQKDPFVLGLLAQAYEKSGDGVKAKELYKQILTINSHSPVTAFARPLAEKKVAAATK